MPVGMAATADEPVHLSKAVNRSRASSIATHPEGYVPFPSPASTQEGATAPPSGGYLRTSWGGHPPPPLTSQRSSEWAPLAEDDGELSVADTNTDLEDADADVDEDEGDHTFNSSQSRGGFSGRNVPNGTLTPATPAGPEIRPTSERTRYSIGSSLADEWETDESGKKYRRGVGQRIRGGLEDTDASEVSDSDFDEVSGMTKKLRIPVEEERTIAIVLAEEGGGLIVNVGGMGLIGLDIKPGKLSLLVRPTQIDADDLVYRHNAYRHACFDNADLGPIVPGQDPPRRRGDASRARHLSKLVNIPSSGSWGLLSSGRTQHWPESSRISAKVARSLGQPASPDR